MPEQKPSRQDQRAQILRTQMALAELRASQSGRSMKCGSANGLYEGRRHAGEPDGCANDGTSCLCECHDEQVLAEYPTPVPGTPTICWNRGER